ncbi:MAG: hypothetical protein QOI38_2047 [Sphingomonadales bacterium]|nr:hypothetical protein [Sphingomonadales bacterium]
MARNWGKQADLAAELGMHKNTLSNILNGEGDPGISRVAALAAKLGVSLDWILTARPAEAPPQDAEPDEDLVRLPMLTPALSAGAGAEARGATHQADWLFPRVWLRRSFGHDDQLELLRVAGDSMTPDLQDGDWVMVDRSRRDPRDGLYALRLADTLLVKRLQFQGRTIRLVSSNPAYPPIELDRQDEALDLEVIGRVVWSSKVHVAA